MLQLAVITDTGNVFVSDTVDTQPPTLDQPSEWGAAETIGFNQQDRFMVAMGFSFVVIRKDGYVFSTEAAPGTTTLVPAFQVDIPRIGFKPQDRFIVNMFSNYLAVITDTGDVYVATPGQTTPHSILTITTVTTK